MIASLRALGATQQESQQEQEPSVLSQVENAKQQWESTIDALPELICIVDEQQRILRANRTLERWQLGSVMQIAGRDFHEVLHPGCHDLACYLRDLLAPREENGNGGGPGTRQVEVYDAALGRHVLARVYPLGGARQGGRRFAWRSPVTGAPSAGQRAVILKDVSKQKQVVRSLRRHAQQLKTINGISRSVLAAESPEEIVAAAIEQLRVFLPVHQAALFLLDAGSSRLRLLATAGPYHGMQRGDTIGLSERRQIAGRPLNRRYYTRNLALLQPRSPLEQAWFEAGIGAYINLPLLADGQWLGCLLLGTRAPHGFSGEDLAVLAELVELLTVALNQSQLRRQLRETNGELQQMLRTRQETMQDLSHELRSPLALIQGFVRLLRDEALGPLTAEQQQALSVVGQRGEHILSLIERLLILQTIGDRVVDLQPTNLKVFLQDTVAPWQLPASNRGIELRMDLPSTLEPVELDVALFPQVISNLLDNALKFTPAGNSVTVSAWNEAQETVIAVSDEGEGIEAERLEVIFDRYIQGDGLTRASGAGIGLALCREVVRAHGGRISAASPGRDQGSTFTVRLPRQGDGAPGAQ